MTKRSWSWSALSLSAVLLVSPWGDPLRLPNLPLCPYKAVSSQPCPLCGLTHAFMWMAQGRLDLAYSANPLVLLLFPLTIAALLLSLAGAAGATLPRRLPAWTVPLAGVLVLSTWIWRLSGI